MLKLMVMKMMGERVHCCTVVGYPLFHAAFIALCLRFLKTNNLERWNTCSTSSKVDAAEGDVWNTYTHSQELPDDWRVSD